MKTLDQLSSALVQGTISSRSLIEDCLSAIEEPSGEGGSVFIATYPEQALAEADLVDRHRRDGCSVSPYAGIPISIKDLFDCMGQVTTAGSKVMADHPPADSDAIAVEQLRWQGFISMGRTNMTEFAYSGLGINHHFGTPANPYQRSNPRIPGGSTSGGAVALTDGMAYASLGTDTSGSCRIPAALCGVVGFKPTAQRVSRRGVIPLCQSQDAVGVMAHSVSCCEIIDRFIGAQRLSPLGCLSPRDLHLGCLTNYVLEGMDNQVADSYYRALQRLADAGVTLTEISMPQLADLYSFHQCGGLVAAEAYRWHQPLLESRGELYDPWIRRRFNTGETQLASDYLQALEIRNYLKTEIQSQTAPFDALVMPTVPVIAPLISDLTSDAAQLKASSLLIRNTAMANILDRCALSIPCHQTGEAPVGLGLLGETLGDEHLLAVGMRVEQCLSAQLG